MPAGVKRFKLLGFGGVGSNGGGVVFIVGLVFVVNESLKVFFVSGLAGELGMMGEIFAQRVSQMTACNSE